MKFTIILCSLSLLVSTSVPMEKNQEISLIEAFMSGNFTATENEEAAYPVLAFKDYALGIVSYEAALGHLDNAIYDSMLSYQSHFVNLKGSPDPLSVGTTGDLARERLRHKKYTSRDEYEEDVLHIQKLCLVTFMINYDLRCSYKELKYKLKEKNEPSATSTLATPTPKEMTHKLRIQRETIILNRELLKSALSQSDINKLNLAKQSPLHLERYIPLVEYLSALRPE